MPRNPPLRPLCGRCVARANHLGLNGALQQRTEDVSNLGMLYTLTGDERYAACARQILLALADAYGRGKGSAIPDPHGYDHITLAVYSFVNPVSIVDNLTFGTVPEPCT